MESLDSEQRQHIADKLRSMAAELVDGQEQRRQDAATVQLDQTRVGRLSRMDALQQQALAQAAERRAEQQLQRVRAALKRIDDPAFGLCIDCRQPIALPRLQADPCVLLCLECQGFRDEDAAEQARRRRVQGR